MNSSLSGPGGGCPDPLVDEAFLGLPLSFETIAIRDSVSPAWYVDQEIIRDWLYGGKQD